MAPTAQTPAFEKAVQESRNLKSKPTDTEMLELYAYFKQGTQDPPFAETKAPGMFELQAKAKRNAWQKVNDTGVTPEDAQSKYVELVEGLKTKYGFDG